jgi:hypothetical protein
LENASSIHHEQADVDSRLANLGFEADLLRRAVSLGLSEGAQCTANDPVILQSFINWGKTVGFLRDQLVPQGWQRVRRAGYETTVSQDGKVALAVAAGDEGTGLPKFPVRTRTPKGPATFKAVLANTGMSTREMSELVDSFPTAEPLPQAKTWILLFFADTVKQEIRVELSLPTGVAQDGQVAVWGERLILEPMSWSGPGAADLLDDGDQPEEPDIPVERR